MAARVARWPSERLLGSVPVQSLGAESIKDQLNVIQGCVATFRLFVAFPELTSRLNGFFPSLGEIGCNWSEPLTICYNKVASVPSE